MLKQGKAKQPAPVAPINPSSPPKTRPRASDSDGEPDPEFQRPAYQTSFSDAIQSALDSFTQAPGGYTFSDEYMRIANELLLLPLWICRLWCAGSHCGSSCCSRWQEKEEDCEASFLNHHGQPGQVIFSSSSFCGINSGVTSRVTEEETFGCVVTVYKTAFACYAMGFFRCIRLGHW